MTSTQPEAEVETELLPAPERERRIGLIRDAVPSLMRLSAEARTDRRQVERWSLPAEWNPGHEPDPRPRPADEPIGRPVAYVLGHPVTFDADPGRIVAHLTPETWAWCGQCAQPLLVGRHPAGSLCTRRDLTDPNNADRIEADA